jgi:hypothetical protein
VRHFSANGHVYSIDEALILQIKEVAEPVRVIWKSIAHLNSFVMVGLQYTKFNSTHAVSPNDALQTDRWAPERPSIID